MGHGHVHVDFVHINTHMSSHLLLILILPSTRIVCSFMIVSYSNLPPSKSMSCVAVLLHSHHVVFIKLLRLCYPCISRFVACVYFVVFGGCLGWCGVYSNW